MLYGNNPLNMCVRRLLVEELMRKLSEGGWWLSRYGDLNSLLESISQQSRPTKLWVD